jgi:CHAT domain-containing protein/tetratricopeptide (TPR) repeat protein
MCRLSLVLCALLVFAHVVPAHAGPDSVAAERARLVALGQAEKWATAESLATALAASEEARPAADSLWLAELCYAVARARYQQHKFLDDLGDDWAGRSLAIRRRRLRADDPVLADTEALLAEFLAEGRADSALGLARSALEIRRRQPVPVDSLVAESFADVGQIEGMLGHGRASIAALEASIAMRERSLGTVHVRLASPLLYLGDAFEQVGDLDSARVVDERAMDILERTTARNDLRRGGPLSRLASLEMQRGDLARAIEYAETAVRTVGTSGDTAAYVTNASNLGVILTEFEDYEGAIQVLEPVLPLCAALGDKLAWLQQAVRQVLGTDYAAARRDSLAMRMFRDAEAGLLAAPEPGGTSRLGLCVLGQAQVLQAWKRHREALAACERGMALNDSATFPERITLATSRALKIRILEALHDRAGLTATRDDLAAVRDARRLAGTSVGPTIGYWLARADQDVGRTDVAWQEALEAEGGVRRQLQLNFTGLPDTRALEFTRRKSYMLGQVLELAGDGDPGRWAIAWDRLVRTRGLVRAELARRRLPPGLAADPEVVRAHDAWVAAQRALARRLVSGAAAAGDSAGNAALAGLRSDAEVAEGAYARMLRARGADTARVEVGLADVRARLGPGQALVAFAEVESRDDTDRVIAFVARGADDRIGRVSVGTSASLRALLAPWRERLAASPGPRAGALGAGERACRRDGGRVRARLWDPIARSIGGAAEVWIVPDGPVADVSWQALPVGDAGYLVEHGPLIRLLDAERELVATPRQAPGGNLLAIGDPAYADARRAGPSSGFLAAGATRASADPCAAGSPRRFPPLPGTGAEARDLAAAWRAGPGRQATVLLGPEATEAAFKRLAPGCTILHLATHGVVAGEDCDGRAAGTRGVGGVTALGAPPGPRGAAKPGAGEPVLPPPWMGRRVWLALAGAEHAGEAGPDGEDGLLTAEEVVTLDLARADWVVLSACHSGLAANWAREGTLGMQRAFELAGARSVIASQWAVEDAATAEWMHALYGARLHGESRAAAALQSACREVLAARRRDGRSTHPFYWAAFRASGE